MRFAHTMIRVPDLEESLAFWTETVGLVEVRRKEVPAGKFTLVFLAAPKDEASSRETRAPELELTYNWEGTDDYAPCRTWGHLAFRVDDIYATCQRLMDKGVTINRPPRDGHMAFFKSPQNISVELIQEDGPLPPQEPWASMKNEGSW